MFKYNPFPLPKHIDSFFFPGEQTSVLCLCKTHINLSLLCVNKHKYYLTMNTNFKYINVYCHVTCMSVSVCVCNACISKIPCRQKKVSGPLRNHRTECLLNGTTFICGTNRGGALSQGWKGEPLGQRNSTICFPGPPQRAAAFSREMVRGVTPGPVWQRDIRQGWLPPPRKISLEEEVWWQTSSHSQGGFSHPCPSQGNQKSVWISISYHCASLAWPRGPGIYRQKKETKPTPCKPPVLLSAWWLSLRMLINISSLIEPSKKSPQNVILKTWGKGRRDAVLLLSKLYFRGIKHWKMSRAQNEVFEIIFLCIYLQLIGSMEKKPHQEFDFFMLS